MGIQEQYEKLAKKYSLPDYSKLDNDFEISTLDSDDFLLREVRRKIFDKFDKFAKILETILQPDAIISDMQECHAFNDSQKTKIYEMFKKLMYFKHLSTETAIEETDELSAEFISGAFDEWQKMKPELKETLKVLRECWKKDTSIHEVLNYMG